MHEFQLNAQIPADCVRYALEEIYSNTKHTAMSWQDPRAATVEKS